jgi:hypothetical protein
MVQESGKKASNQKKAEPIATMFEEKTMPTATLNNSDDNNTEPNSTAPRYQCPTRIRYVSK